MKVRIIHADMLEALPQLLAEGVQFDAVVTDPPYGIAFMGRAWDAADNIAFRPETWAAVLAVMKPGAHLIAFSGTRTYHRMACAIEDAGFEIRDMMAWMYGAGFPKSHDIAKAIDKAAGVRGHDSTGFNTAGRPGDRSNGGDVFRSDHPEYVRPEAITDEARQWQGWGTALKPAHEPIVLARAPFRGTVAANVLANGCGGLNIDACRVEGAPPSVPQPVYGVKSDGVTQFGAGVGRNGEMSAAAGRWPANVIHDGSDEVLAAFPQTADSKPGGTRGASQIWGGAHGEQQRNGHNDSGSAARFFYSAKADAGDRLGSKHPTVKPVDLMAYLLRLVTPAGGLVLDPFAGSGTTGMAALREGFDAVLIEREAEYVADIRRRVAHVSGEDSPLFAGAAA